MGTPETSGSFWRKWSQRVAKNTDKFIRPDDPSVQAIANSLDKGRSNYATAKSVWNHIYETAEYQESGRWRTPTETIQSNSGDCDDLTFLQTSILTALQIPCSICGGTLTFPDGVEEEHVWNTVSGQVVDATGEPNNISHLTYTTYSRVDIKPK